MAKKMAMMRKVLCCFVVIAILMSVMSTSVLGVNANITSVSGMDKSTFGSNEIVSSMQGKMEIKFIGTTVERCGIVAGADYWVVTVDELISGPSWSGQLTVYTIDIFADSPTWGYADPDITVRDKVEVYGKCVVRFADVYYVTLNGREDYYIKKKSDTPPKPDLTITRIWFNKNPCDSGDDIEIIFDVTNQGTGVANSCEDCLYIDGSKVAEFDSSGLAIGSELKPGETRTWYYLYEYVPGNPDPHKIKACADCLNSVTESDESNNCKIDDLDVESGREEIKFTGTSIEYFSRMGASGWTVRADEIISGPLELQGHTVTAYLASVNPDEYPYGYIDPNIEAGDKVEVYGWYQGGDNVALVGSKDYYIKRGGGCGKILEYALSDGSYSLPQTVMAHMKYKNYMTSPTKFKGVFLVRNQRTDKIYSCSKEQITNIDDRFGYGKGNSLQIRFEDEVEDIGVYDAKLELRNFYTDELCDETEWLEDQFKIEDGSASRTCINFDELNQGDITGQTLHYEQVD